MGEMGLEVGDPSCMARFGGDELLAAVAEAASLGWAEHVRAAMRLGADLGAELADGSTALGACARAGSAEGVALLLSLGADPEKRSVGGISALMEAARCPEPGRWLCARALIAAGADPRATDREGLAAADHAAEAGLLELAAFLRSMEERADGLGLASMGAARVEYPLSPLDARSAR